MSKVKEILDNFEKYEARYKLHNETQFIITHREIQILLDYITNLQQYYNDNVNKYEELLVKYSDLQEENERLNNTIEEKKIPEKLKLSDYNEVQSQFELDVIARINQLIDYLKSKGE